MMMRTLYSLFFVLILVAIAALQSCGDDESPSPPQIEASVSSLIFGNIIAGEISIAQNYTITASNLSGDVIVTTEAPFGVSNSETGIFSTTLSLGAELFADGAVTVYVVYQPALGTIGNSTGTISHETSGLDDVPEVTLSGSASEPLIPSLTISVSDIDFGVVKNNSDVDPLSYTIGGQNLTSDVTIATTSPYSLSLTEDGTYSESIVLASTDFGSSAITIYVDLSPTTYGEQSATITHTSSDVPDAGSVSLTAESIADLIFLENFDYDRDTLASVSTTGTGSGNAVLDGWIDIRTGRAPIDLVADANLSYTGYDFAGGKAVRAKLVPPASTGSQLNVHNLERTQSTDFVGAFYASFLMRIDGLPANNQLNRPVMFVDWVEATGAADFLGAVTVRTTDDVAKFGVRYRSLEANSEMLAEVGKTYLVVLKHTIPDTDVTNANNELSVYVFDNEAIPATEPTSPDAQMTTPADVGDGNLIKGISILQDNSGPGDYLVDGIKVANSWEDLFVQ